MRVYQNYYVRAGGEWKLVIIGISGNKGVIDTDVASVPEFLAERWIKNNMISVTEVKIDEADIEKLRAIQWLKTSCDYVRGMLNVKGQKRRKLVFLHRYLLEPPEGMVVDHINGDTLDNRRCNLRVATYSQNSHNKESINVRQVGNNFNVHFKVKGVQRSFGTFKTLEEALNRRAEIKQQLAFGTLTAEPEVKSSTGQRYVKRRGSGYDVVIPIGGKRKSVGSFKDFADAVAARNMALTEILKDEGDESGSDEGEDSE